MRDCFAFLGGKKSRFDELDMCTVEFVVMKEDELDTWKQVGRILMLRYIKELVCNEPVNSCP